MGKINLIRGNRKKNKSPRKFMVSITFDVWAATHEEATSQVADYLEMNLTNGCPHFIVFEATELDQKSTWTTLDNGKDIRLG